MVCEAFATQNTEFATSTDDDYNPDTEKRKCPTQLVYASSQDDMTKIFYKHYKNFAKKMMAGDRDYFVCDMICDTAINTFMNGKPYTPLLTQGKVDSALKANKEKALREYYNNATRDGGSNQIVKWGTVRRNETFYLPQLTYQKDTKILLALDPARTGDNSILGIMRIVDDPVFGYIGEIVNCINFVDSARRDGYKLDSNRQLKGIRETLVAYNGNFNDYVNIEALLIDQGAGGGGTSTYADGMLNDWTDDSGRLHRGLIDANHDIYKGYKEIYPNALDKLRLISPRKYRTQMIEELIELMDSNLIKFPYEYKQDYVSIARNENGNEVMEVRQLDTDEIIALQSIDIMKTELTSMYKYTNAEGTTVSYQISKEKQKTLHDDRMYTLAMLAHYLYELRRNQQVKQEPEKTDFSQAPVCISSLDF